MVEHTFVLEAERKFFAALTNADAHELRRLLDDAFVLIDLSGTVLSRAGFVSAIESGHLKFESIRVVNSEVRLYGETAIVTGETEMRGTSQDQYFHAFSRYTHVYREQDDDSFVLVSAQGTLVTREVHP
jgi:ketosteroid isomerase-like protein